MVRRIAAVGPEFFCEQCRNEVSSEGILEHCDAAKATSQMAQHPMAGLDCDLARDFSPPLRRTQCGETHTVPQSSNWSLSGEMEERLKKPYLAASYDKARRYRDLRRKKPCHIVIAPSNLRSVRA